MLLTPKTTTRVIRVPITTTAEMHITDALREVLRSMLFPTFGAAHQKVSAIKLIRVEYGIGLKEAKDIAEGLTLDMLTNPESL